MTNANAAHKITRAHHSRKAVVYLRQSSLAQVKRNTESQRLQYALADTAKLYGFRHIEVIDRDLGLSAASGAPAREGFKELLASIALGEVGLVLSRELSRLARTDQDWCHLMELCRVFDTLLGDALDVLSILSLQLVPAKPRGCAVVSTGAIAANLPKWIEAWNPGRIFCAYSATRNGDDAARRLIEKDTRIVRMRPALHGQSWNDMLLRDRAGEPLETDDRPIG